MNRKKRTFLISAVALLGGLFFFPWSKSSPPSQGCAFCNADVLEKGLCYEDDLVLVLYTHQPILPAHFLIIPKRHIDRFEMLSEQEMVRVMQVVDKVRKAVEKELGMASYLLHQKNGKEVGQSVPHVHFHFIAREQGDSSLLKLMMNAVIAYLRGPIAYEHRKEMIDQMKAALQ